MFMYSPSLRVNKLIGFKTEMPKKMTEVNKGQFSMKGKGILKMDVK